MRSLGTVLPSGSSTPRALTELSATKCIESIVFTPEKIEKLGLEPDALPIGWWIGFHVGDDEVWKGVKDGTYRMFSIRGTGTREPLDA